VAENNLSYERFASSSLSYAAFHPLFQTIAKFNNDNKNNENDNHETIAYYVGSSL
jgi:hypothetical protein